MQRKPIVIFPHATVLQAHARGHLSGVVFTQPSCLIWQLTSTPPLDRFPVGLRGRRLCTATSNVHASPRTHVTVSETEPSTSTGHISSFWILIEHRCCVRLQATVHHFRVIYGISALVFLKEVLTVLIAILSSHYWNVRKLSVSLKTCSEVLSISASEVNSGKQFMLGAVEKPFGAVPRSFLSHLCKQNRLFSVFCLIPLKASSGIHDIKCATSKKTLLFTQQQQQQLLQAELDSPG